MHSELPSLSLVKQGTLWKQPALLGSMLGAWESRWYMFKAGVFTYAHDAKVRTTGHRRAPRLGPSTRQPATGHRPRHAAGAAHAMHVPGSPRLSPPTARGICRSCLSERHGMQQQAASHCCTLHHSGRAWLLAAVSQRAGQGAVPQQGDQGRACKRRPHKRTPGEARGRPGPKQLVGAQAWERKRACEQ
jgi:hypothetical protein